MPKKVKPAPQADESWLMTYSDSITLLMAFFVLLLSVSTIDQAKVEQMVSGISTTFQKTESDQPFTSMSEKLNEIVENEQLEGKISITPDPLGLKLRFSSQVLFESGSATLKKVMIPMLSHISQAIQESEYKDYIVKIEGHTDDIPIKTALYESNWELSAHRATNVLKEFIKTGIPKKRVRAIAMADAYPLVPNQNPNGSDNIENQAKNRRIEVYIHRNFK